MNSSRALWLCCSLCVCVLIHPVSAEDWLQFRGSAGDGISPVTGLPTSWSAKEHVKWRSELPGIGWSSPVITAGRIYVTTAIPLTDDAQSERELALLIVDAGSGDLLKRVKLFTQPASAPKIHSKNSHASPTPILDSDRVYIHFGHAGTACTNLDGQLVWRNDQLTYPPVHGNGGSPALVDGLLIFSQDGGDVGQVVALSAATGEVVWKRARDVDATKKFSFCTPLVMQEAGRNIVVLPGSNVVQALDTKTGDELWRVRYEGYSVIPRPIIAAGLIMVCTGYDKPTLMAIKPGGRGDVTDTHVAWTLKTSVPHTPSLNTRNGLLFMVDDKGIASCVEAASGQEVWKERIGGNFSASPILVGDNLYLLSEEGVTTIVKAEREFQIVAKNQLNERTLASMAVVDRDLLIRSQEALYRVSQLP